ncbi:MAG: hypothetical protein ACRC8Q_11050, partial [Aeromonas sp.]
FFITLNERANNKKQESKIALRRVVLIVSGHSRKGIGEAGGPFIALAAYLSLHIYRYICVTYLSKGGSCYYTRLCSALMTVAMNAPHHLGSR